MDPQRSEIRSSEPPKPPPTLGIRPLDNTARSPRLIAFQGTFFAPVNHSFGTETRSLYSGIELGTPVRDVTLDVRLLSPTSGSALIIAEILSGERRTLFAMRSPSRPDAARCAFVLSTFLASHDSHALTRLLSDAPRLWIPITPEFRDTLLRGEGHEVVPDRKDDLHALSFRCLAEAEIPVEKVPLELDGSKEQRSATRRSAIERGGGMQVCCGGAIICLERLENSFRLTVRRAATSPTVPPFEALVPIQRATAPEQDASLRALLEQCRGASPAAALANLQGLFSKARWRLSGSKTGLTNPILCELRSELGGELPFFRSAWQSPRASVPPREALSLLEDLLLGRERLLVQSHRFSRMSPSQMELCLDHHANGTITLGNADGVSLRFRVNNSTFGGHGVFGVTDFLSTFVPEPDRLLNELFLRAEFVQDADSPFAVSHSPALCHGLRLAEEFERVGSQPGCPASIWVSAGRLSPERDDAVQYCLRNGRGVEICVEIGPHGPQQIRLERRLFGVRLKGFEHALNFGSPLDADFMRAFYGTWPSVRSCQALLSRVPSLQN